MPYVNCKTCGNKFYAKPSWLKKGYGKYCSGTCHHEGMKNGKIVNCFICSKKTYKPLKALNHSKSKKYFCSKSCQTIWRNSIVYVGSKHPNWTGGQHVDYRKILKKAGKKETCYICRTIDKRVLAVHHVDHNHKNNKIENLTWLCHNCHFIVHNYKSEKMKFMEALV